MAERHEQHRRIAMSVTVTLCGLDQLLDLAWRQVLALAILAVGQSRRDNCSVYRFWPHQLEVRFHLVNSMVWMTNCSYIGYKAGSLSIGLKLLNPRVQKRVVSVSLMWEARLLGASALRARGFRSDF